MVLQSHFDRTQPTLVHSHAQDSPAHTHPSHRHTHDQSSDHHHPEAQAHTHGVIAPELATSDRGLWAVKWSFVGLMITALLQVGVVVLSGSVALLADTIHNVADAATAIPLGVAFWLARRPPTAWFTYGYGRVEDLAGVVIVGIICLSALITGYESIDRLVHPHPMQQIGFVALAAVIGFVGNELVARFRIRVGQEINSAALVADGYHARVDSFTSLAVLASAIATGLGFPVADPVIGLVITVAIGKLVLESAQAVFTRLLDGVDPTLTQEIHHAVEQVNGVTVRQVRSRWLGHQLQVHLQLAVAANLSIAEAQISIQSVREQLKQHLPYLREAIVELEPRSGA